ncbi:thermonuclease family protein [Paenarthrobacter nitroguajacolicus]
MVDGDTIRISCDGTSTRVRLVGINAPESVKEDAPVECGGPEASTYLHSLLDGQQVFLSADPGQGVRDKYDRILAYVWTADVTLANRAILEHGHAKLPAMASPSPTAATSPLPPTKPRTAKRADGVAETTDRTTPNR